MRLRVIGSGGCAPLPMPTCFCSVCSEAREKGAPYARSGCSIFIEDINTLIDTPEDSVVALNREKIKRVDRILYSHWDPDHTLGLRVIEALKLNWFDALIFNKGPEEKIEVAGLNQVIEDIKSIRNKYGSYLDYYQMRKLIDVTSIEDNETIQYGNIRITFIPVLTGDTATVFVVEEEKENGEKVKAIYAPCDIKPFPDSEMLNNAHLMVLGNVYPEGPLKDGVVIPKGNELEKTLFSMKEVLDLKKKHNIERVVITHIEEDWGKSYDDYKTLEQEKYLRDNIQFAYDGMEIEI